MVCAAYAMLWTKCDMIRALVDAVDKLSIIIFGIITHKTVKSLFKVILADNFQYCRGLRAASVITEEVTEGDKYVSLLVRGIFP